MLIYQIKNQGIGQMMGYVFIADNGKVIVFDGGRNEEVALLREILAMYGNHIDYWFLTHPHPDHHDAFIDISKSPENITVGTFYYSPVDINDVPIDNPYYPGLVNFYEAIAGSPFNVKQYTLGETFTEGNLFIEVMGVSNPEIKENIFNNASCPIMLTESYDDGTSFKVLMLGDLAIEGGNKLLCRQKERIKADMVQMAHHGQDAAEEHVYKAIAPRYTLWPTPDWLWSNTADPQKPGQGPWKTLIVRGWMEKLGAIPITSLEKTAVIKIDNGRVSVDYYSK